ncbi:MAG TPA: peptidyl-prolyl cis-trans isomerase [Thermoanaerobaculia bacterium]|nr:peptidyl-prolyl cis-trans isomerase [Thermoanaerobaculia bacterium]
MAHLPLSRRSLVVLALAGGLVLGTLGVAAEARAQDAGEEGQVIDRIMLRVNDRIATLWEYQRQLANVRRDILSSSGVPTERQRELLDDAPRQVLRSMFDEMLVLSRADQLGLTVSDIEIDEQIQAQAEQFGLQDERELRMALAREGLTLEEYRENLREQQLWRLVTGRELYPRIEVADEDLRDLYQENVEEYQVPERRRIREVIVLDTNQLAGGERREVAEQIAASWREGADPEALAQEHGPEIAMLFDVGWVSRPDLSAELADQVFALEPGQVSSPVEARGGLHVVELLEVEEASVRPFEEVRTQLLQRERARRFEDELVVYLQELEEKAYFEGSGLPSELSDFQTASGRLVREGSAQILERAAASGEAGAGEDGGSEGDG